MQQSLGRAAVINKQQQACAHIEIPGVPHRNDYEEQFARVAAILDDAGFRSEVASNYADGVELLTASQPALLIADVMLPGGGDGHELAEVARRLGVATLLVSGHPDVIAEAAARGHPFLAKPSSCPNCNG